jgi:hypothetical protein
MYHILAERSQNSQSFQGEKVWLLGRLVCPAVRRTEGTALTSTERLRLRLATDNVLEPVNNPHFFGAETETETLATF